MSESDIPSQFMYIVPIVEKYGIDEAQEEGFLEGMIDRLEIEDFSALAGLYEEMRTRGDSERLSSWMWATETDRSSAHWRSIFILFLLFRSLEARGVKPFSSGDVRLAEPLRETLDWSKLPSDLSYLAEPAAQYGVYQSDDEIDRFCAEATPSDLIALRTAAKRILVDANTIEAWMNEVPMTNHRESELVYFLQGVIDRLGLFSRSANDQ